MNAITQYLTEAWRVHQSGHVADAEHRYRQVLQTHPQNSAAWCYLGIALHDRGRFEEAVEAYDRALSIEPNFPVALSNRGNSLNSLGRHGEAESSCLQAIELKPDYASPYNNLGAALVAMGKLTEAVVRFDDALRLNPQYASAHSNRGAALVQQGRFDDAQSSTDEAIRLDPKYADAHKNRAIVTLLMGDFENGWQDYEWRLRSGEVALPRTDKPRWDGSDPTGKTILLWAEQGLGDTLQFIRYASLVKERGGRVVAAVQKPLLRILAGCPGVDLLVAQGELNEPFDAYAPLLSLPGIFKTELDSIPAETSYLAASEELVAKWKASLGPRRGLRVGVAWQGNPGHHLDRQRSAPLEVFRILTNVPDIELICLQKGLGHEQIEALSPPFPVRQLGDDFDSSSGAFMDTAAVMQLLDVVVTTDTSIAHLAGALGVETLVALSLAPDWRWLLERDDSPWYPSLRLFRQAEPGDWAGVFDRIAKTLQERNAGPTKQDSRFSPSLLTPISPGELLDKLTILQIKSERIQDEQKLRNVEHEKDVLEATRKESLAASLEVTLRSELDGLEAKLKHVNEQLWDIEDEIRICEKQRDFGPKFIELARSVYRTNDVRASLKREINELLGASIVEEKSYESYE